MTTPADCQQTPLFYHQNLYQFSYDYWLEHGHLLTEYLYCLQTTAQQPALALLNVLADKKIPRIPKLQAFNTISNYQHGGTPESAYACLMNMDNPDDDFVELAVLGLAINSYTLSYPALHRLLSHRNPRIAALSLWLLLFTPHIDFLMEITHALYSAHTEIRLQAVKLITNELSYLLRDESVIAMLRDVLAIETDKNMIIALRYALDDI